MDFCLMRGSLKTLFFVTALGVMVPGLRAAQNDDKPLQVCTPLSTGPCGTLPRFKGSRSVKVPAGESLMDLEGTVILNLVVTAEGSPRDIEVTESTAGELRKIALETAKSWRFEPGTCEGKAVPTQILARISFSATHEPMVQLGSAQMSSADPKKIEKMAAEAAQALDRRDYPAAVATAQDVLALVPLAQRIRLVLGMALLELDRYEEAEAALQEEIKLDPASPFAYDRLGRIYWREHKYEDAITQFKKQINTTPEGFDAYADLGVLLCGRKRCSEAMSSLDKAMAMSPNQSRVLMAHGECKLDLGETEKAIREMEDAANQSGSADSWNQAAYRMAQRSVELERAQAWSDSAISILSAPMKSGSLEHVKPTQLRWVHSMAEYWDTRSWIYYRRGNSEMAQSFAEAAWSLRPSPTMGNHLGQIYENLGRTDDAQRMFALAIAAANLPTKAATRPEDQAEAMDHLTKLAGAGVHIPGLIEKAKAELDSQNSVTVPNYGKLIGNGDFLMEVSADGKVTEVREISGDHTLAFFSDVLQKTQSLFPMPKDAGIELARRGRLTCESGSTQCRFKVLRSEEAWDLAVKEARNTPVRAAE